MQPTPIIVGNKIITTVIGYVIVALLKLGYLKYPLLNKTFSILFVSWETKSISEYDYYYCIRLRIAPFTVACVFKLLTVFTIS